MPIGPATTRLTNEDCNKYTIHYAFDTYALGKATINDMFTKAGHIREDGRMVHDMYLVEVKRPEESKTPWDYYKVLATIPAERAFQPLSASRCPLIKM